MNDDAETFDLLKTHFKRITCDRINVLNEEVIGRERIAALDRAKIFSFQDQVLRGLVVGLETYIHGIEKERLVIRKKWPKTWWDAFKDRWFPEWAKQRWPVEWEEIDIDQKIFLAVCPHLQTDSQNKHWEWLGRSQSEEQR